MQISSAFTDAVGGVAPVASANPVEAIEAFKPKPTYGFVRTRELLDAFASLGWHETRTETARVRKAEREGYQKHLVRLEHADFQSIEGLDARNHSRPQLVLLNSHDRSTSFRLWWGLLRFACMNGIILGDWLGQLRLCHSARVVDRLADGTAALVRQAPRMIQHIGKMGRTNISAAAIEDFTRKAYDARLREHGRVRVTDLEIDYTLPLLRKEDDAADVFTVTNRIQEVCLRGGIHYSGTAMRKDDNGVLQPQRVERRSRYLGSVTQQVAMNQEIHRLALEYVE